MQQKVYRIKGGLTPESLQALSEQLRAVDGVTAVDITVREDAAEGRVSLEAETESALHTAESMMHEVLGEGVEIEPMAEEMMPTDSQVKNYIAAEPLKEGKKIPLSAALGTVIVSVILAILITFSTTVTYIQKAPPAADIGEGTADEGKFDQLTILDRLFRVISPLEVDDKATLEAVLKAYVAATGDEYAQYYTAEEFDAYMETNEGNMVGIGISIIEDVLTVGAMKYQVITVVNVYPESPAEEAGILPGDAIMYVGEGESKELVDTLGYEQALTLLKGEEGTVAQFEVFRRSEEAEGGFESVAFTVARRALETRSVLYRVCDTDKSVGIIRVTGFEEKTAQQFADAVDALKTGGCTKFVFDLRYNLGGLLTSVVDMLAYFTQVGDEVISVKDKNGAKESIFISDKTSKDGFLTIGSGKLTPADIGKYRDLNFSVLVNEYSASAAELFTANVRDYELGTVVGVTTFGKGSIQTFVKLDQYGYDGALKITYGHYYPPCGEGYHGLGIAPHVEIAQSEEALKYNFNLLPDELDVQLQKAIEVLD